MYDFLYLHVQMGLTVSLSALRLFSFRFWGQLLLVVLFLWNIRIPLLLHLCQCIVDALILRTGIEDLCWSTLLGLVYVQLGLVHCWVWLILVILFSRNLRIPLLLLIPLLSRTDLTALLCSRVGLSSLPALLCMSCKRPLLRLFTDFKIYFTQPPHPKKKRLQISLHVNN